MTETPDMNAKMKLATSKEIWEPGGPVTDRLTRQLNTDFVSGKMSTGQRISRIDRLRHQEPSS